MMCLGGCGCSGHDMVMIGVDITVLVVVVK